ncbi:polysaccharide export outer membrane protein [Methylobacter tundripaludum]|jgi:polysaccharide export outer membrane protein|uniref:Polysaccharide export outer membrane protein n=1 Tax=Methylobacter tundripaludum TaxID=173365 RepID=A0A2S6HE56_9GAMM|nr:polysaccharide biosynthesis/export family protein [Methylobacter tundripaludum]PPK75720.1 polysaccharide export outer membrane protein [Methylobacter tundripaludum]
MNTFTLKSLIPSYYGRGLGAIFFGCILLLSNQTSALAGSVYRLNPGDKLEITVWQEENLKQEVVVLPDGTISFPLVGHVPAAGKTTEDLVRLLQERLDKFIPDSEINVRLLAAEGNLVYVTGEVAHPGQFVMKGPMDVMQALSMAGGLTAFAKKNSIIVLRRQADGQTRSFPFEYGDVEDGENIESNILLQSGDTIVAP